MKNIKNKPAAIGMIVCGVLMFALIGLCVLLTGGREPQNFTKTDWIVFVGFVILEIVNLVALFILADRVGKANVQAPQPKPKNNREKNFQLRGFGVYILSFILAMGFFCCAPAVEKLLPASIRANALTVFIALCAVAPVLALFNHGAGSLYFRRFKTQSVRENQDFFLAHRQDAVKTAAQKLRLLRTLRILNMVYVVFLSLLAACVCIFGSMVIEDGRMLPMFYGFFLFMCAVSRLRLPTPQKVYEDDSTLVTPEEYPVLYSLARKAADAVGCKGGIKIFLWDDHGASIYSEDYYHCLFLGVGYISLLSEQELYAILLHEFRHATYAKQYNAREKHYNDWLANGGNPHYMSNLASHLFVLGDVFYRFHYLLYKYASSISIEVQADEAMALHGDVKAAASALMKLHYIGLYKWELGTYDDESIYIPEEADDKHLTHRNEKFQNRLAQRQNYWNQLIDKEILSRTASHPTLKMRLDVLGVTDYETLSPEQDTPYALEIQKAVDRLDNRIYENWSKEYDEKRQEYYLAPLKTVEEWENQGMPLIAEEYAAVIDALRMLDRNTEADALCRRAMDDLPAAAAAYGLFMHGCFLLHSYDPAGIELIYQAMEENNNYMDSGLDIIGQFCCMTGNQEALDHFRQKAVELSQRDQDLYSHIDTLEKNDRLSKENLPDGMLEEILAYIRSIDGDCISHIYLVRKNVTDDFFTSAFVIRFKIGTPGEQEDEVMDKIFNHLDTCSSWQFSLFSYTRVISAKVDQIEGSCVYQA